MKQGTSDVMQVMLSEMTRHDKRVYHPPTTAYGNDPDSHEALVEFLLEDNYD